MVITKLIQSGLSVKAEGEEYTYTYSKNLEFQFEKDANYEGYTVTPFFCLQDGTVGKLSITTDGIFKLDQRFFETDGYFFLSFQLEKGEEIQHLEKLAFKVKQSVGNTTSILPNPPTLWIQYVDEEMDAYFKKNYQSKLDDFITKYNDFVKKYDVVVEDTKQVASNTTLVASNTALAKNYMESAKESADKILNAFGLQVVDGYICMKGE